MVIASYTSSSIAVQELFGGIRTVRLVDHPAFMCVDPLNLCNLEHLTSETTLRVFGDGSAGFHT